MSWSPVVQLSGEKFCLQCVCYDEEGGTQLISYSSLHRSIVTVYVSPEKFPFYFHKRRLCQQSPFYEKAFHGSFEEASTGSIYLEEAGIDEFESFEEWLYSEKLNYPRDSENLNLLLAKLLCFADKVAISAL